MQSDRFAKLHSLYLSIALQTSTEVNLDTTKTVLHLWLSQEIRKILTLLHCLTPLKRSRLIVLPTAACAVPPLTSSLLQDWSHPVCQQFGSNLKCMIFFRPYLNLHIQPSNVALCWWWKYVLNIIVILYSFFPKDAVEILLTEMTRHFI